MSMENLKVALVHDELTRRGGAEVVLEELLRIFPQAHVYTLYAGRPRLKLDGRTYQLRTSFLQRAPLWFRRHPSRLLPLLPHAAERFDLSSYHLAISSASGFAKSIITRVNVPHLCYCHTPTRYLWDSTHQVTARQNKFTRPAGVVLLHYLRLADFTAAQRADVFLANSRYTARRIKSYYRRGSTVVYPPIDTAYFTPSPAGRTLATAKKRPYFLLIGRLSPDKNAEQAVAVCEKLRLNLVIVGKGAYMPELKKIAGKYTHLTGQVTAGRLRDYLREARALLQPGVEDFGMAAAEALSCGTPVLALKKGGVLEIVRDGKTGLLYEDPLEEQLAEVIRRFLTLERKINPRDLQQSVAQFSRSRFVDQIRQEARRVADKIRHGNMSA